MKMHKPLSIFFDLTRFRIAFFAACSAVTGLILADRRLSFSMILPILGIFLLACGASALNQVQERRLDARMTRTAARPLPAQRISPETALAVALVLLFGGLFLLARSSFLVVVLGFSAIFWYNGVYTVLKRKTAFAVIPGTLVGVFPPLIGWVAGGGTGLPPKIVALLFFFFLWQVPHFWLLLADHGVEYEKAGLPALTALFSALQLRRMTAIWLLATAVAGLMLPLFGLTDSPRVLPLYLLGTILLSGCGIALLRSRAGSSLDALAFRATNLFVLFVMVLLSFGGLL